MSSVSPVRILLVDDSGDNYSNIQELLGSEDISHYDILWTDNYIKGIKELSSEKFDICLVRYELENNGGVEFQRYVGLHDQSLPTIFLTNEPNEIAAKATEELGVVDCLAYSELTPALLKRIIKYAISLKGSEKKLLDLSYRDSLTGIPNRSLFQVRIKDAMALSSRQKTMVAVLFLDVDNFKDINDLMGYQAGDQLLVEIAKRLQIATRESDIISRLGGDEFAVVATNIQSERDVVIVASRLLDSLLEPINVECFDFKVSVSIGIALSPSDGENVEALVRSGDEALYQAKAVNRGTYHFFNKEMQIRRKEAQKFEKDLHKSIENNELFLQYQPVIELKTGAVVGAEALVRWRHPERNIVPPDEFISIAERTGFINELGNWVLLESCRQCVNWNKKFSDNFTMAVNVSLAQLRKGDFVEVVQDAVMQTGISYKNLTLEITESMIADNTSVVLESLNKLRDLGAHISIDDFGTGHSSLARLKNFPVNDLKIDRSLISRVAEDRQDAAIAMAILTLARELELDVIAEGIETIEQAEFMSAQDCTYAQGYYYSRPVLAEEFETLFLETQEKTA
ncbi:MAG: two-component system response regulator [Methyloligellaceae bacterium]